MALPSYAHGTSSTPLLGETIGENLRRTALRVPERDALVVRSQGYRATYRQLWDATTEVALGLMARGVERGDRVGIWAPNRFEWVLAQYATARIGAILVNVNPAYKTAELEYALRQSGASVLLLAAGFRQNDYRRMLGEVRDRCPELRLALVHRGRLADARWSPKSRVELKRARSGGSEARERLLQFDDT